MPQNLEAKVGERHEIQCPRDLAFARDLQVFTPEDPTGSELRVGRKKHRGQSPSHAHEMPRPPRGRLQHAWGGTRLPTLSHGAAGGPGQHRTVLVWESKQEEKTPEASGTFPRKIAP